MAVMFLSDGTAASQLRKYRMNVMFVFVAINSFHYCRDLRRPWDYSWGEVKRAFFS